MLCYLCLFVDIIILDKYVVLYSPQIIILLHVMHANYTCHPY